MEKDASKVGYKHYCSKCHRDVGNFTKRVHKVGLQSLLTTKVLGTGDALSVTRFVKAMKQSRNTIFHNDDVPQIGMASQIHGVWLQMIAGGVLS